MTGVLNHTDSLGYYCENLSLMTKPVVFKNQILNLTGNQSLKKVSYFSSVKTLILSYCYRIQDFSPVAMVPNLDLSYCTQLTNANMFSKVKNLNLSGCKEITDVSGLMDLHSLNISYCPKIKDVNILENLHTLVINGCDGIKDISNLGRIRYLYANETDITAFPHSCKNRFLSLNNCYTLKTNAMVHFSDVYELSITHSYITSLIHLKATKFLIISQNTKVPAEQITEWEKTGKVVKVSEF
jgi:hypothetical protein